MCLSCRRVLRSDDRLEIGDCWELFVYSCDTSTSTISEDRLAGRSETTHVTSDQWRRAKHVLTQAIALEPAEQERLLRTQFSDDQQLCVELLDLLRSWKTASLRFRRSLLLETGRDVFGRRVSSWPSDSPAPNLDNLDTPSPWFLEPGDMCRHYRVIRLLGTGGMGQVYLAENTNLGTPVALKLVSDELLGSLDARARLQREAGRAARLQFLAHIATVTEFMELELKGRQVAVLVMEYVAGTPASRLVEDGPIRAGRAIGWAIQIAEAIEAAHEKEILHCDLKPANVMIVADNDAKVLDFGIARALYDIDSKEPIAGTLHYMAPELLNGGAFGKTVDIYGLGVTLFELLTGRRPYESAQFDDFLLQVIGAPVPKVSELVRDVPKGLDGVLARAMEKNPQQRYQSAQELKRALMGVRDSSESEKRGRRARVAFYASAVAVTFGVLTILGSWTSAILDQALGRVDAIEFRRETVFSWPWWGFRSLLPEIGFATLYYLLFLVMRATYSLGLTVPWVQQTCGHILNKVRDHFHKADVATTCQVLLLLQLGALAAFLWSYWPLLDTVVSFAIHRIDTPLRDLSRGDEWTSTYNDLYGVTLSVQLFLFSFAWLRMFRRLREHKDGLPVIIGGAAAFAFTLLLISTPYRVMYKADGERVTYRSQTCYMVGETVDQGLLFCPLSDTQRQTVPKADPNLKRTGIIESVFSVFETQEPATP